MNIERSCSDPKSVNDQRVHLYNDQFKPFQTGLEKFVADRLVEAKIGRADEQNGFRARREKSPK